MITEEAMAVRVRRRMTDAAQNIREAVGEIFSCGGFFADKFFLLAEKEAAILYLFFFGHYPILKGLIEKIKKAVIEWVLKISVFIHHTPPFQSLPTIPCCNIHHSTVCLLNCRPLQQQDIRRL